MFRKTLAVILTLISIICAIPMVASAQVAPPAAFDAPEHFGVSHYYNDSVIFTFSAPEDMRDYIERWKAEDENNHIGMSVYYQIDYRIDNGNWHHTSAWDSPKTVPDEIDSLYFVFGTRGNYNSSERWSLYSLFPGDQSLSQFREAGWEYLKSHSITLYFIDTGFRGIDDQ